MLRLVLRSESMGGILACRKFPSYFWQGGLGHHVEEAEDFPIMWRQTYARVGEVSGAVASVRGCKAGWG